MWPCRLDPRNKKGIVCVCVCVPPQPVHYYATGIYSTSTAVLQRESGPEGWLEGNKVTDDDDSSITVVYRSCYNL